MAKTAENRFDAKISELNFSTLYVDAFPNEQAAVSQMLSRRLLLQRSFQSYLEPYFGKVEKADCTSKARLDGNLVSDGQGGRSFFLEFPVERDLVPFDCGKGNPPIRARYEFHYCPRRHQLYEARVYVPAGAPPNDGLLFRCDPT